MSLRRVLAYLSAFMAIALTGPSAQAQLFGTGPWSGLYLGVHGGYSWEKDAGSSAAALDGSQLGVQAGYNLQLGNFLVGIEGDYTWSQAKGREIQPSINVTASVDSMWSVRGRLGFVVANSVLLYGTAGYGGFDVGVSGLVGSIAFSGNAKFDGFVAGGGLEVLVTRNIMVRGEALRYMGDGSALAAGVGSDMTVLRAALSYKF